MHVSKLGEHLDVGGVESWQLRFANESQEQEERGKVPGNLLKRAS